MSLLSALTELNDRVCSIYGKDDFKNTDETYKIPNKYGGLLTQGNQLMYQSHHRSLIPIMGRASEYHMAPSAFPPLDFISSFLPFLHPPHPIRPSNKYRLRPRC